MEGSIYEYLFEFGSMGLFAAFLIWQHLNMQKRFDKLVSEFQEQIEKLRDGQKEEVEEIRDRYDKVIGSYNDERTAIRVNLAEKIGKVSAKLDDLPFDNVLIQTEALSLAQRNSYLIIERIMEMMKSANEEQKIRDMARKLSDKE
jgi:hypothetical protein